MMARDGEGNVHRLQAPGSILPSLCDHGAVDGMGTATFSSADHLLKAVLILTKIVKQARPLREIMEMRIVRGCARCQVTGELSDVFEMLCKGLPLRGWVIFGQAGLIGVCPEHHASKVTREMA